MPPLRTEALPKTTLHRPCSAPPAHTLRSLMSTPPTIPVDANRAVLDVMRNLSLAMALVAEARDQGKPASAAAAKGYLNAALAALTTLEKT